MQLYSWGSLLSFHDFLNHDHFGPQNFLISTVSEFCRSLVNQLSSTPIMNGLNKWGRCLNQREAEVWLQKDILKVQYYPAVYTCTESTELASCWQLIPQKDISSTATERSGCFLSFPKRPNPKNTPTKQNFLEGCYHLI